MTYKTLKLNVLWSRKTHHNDNKIVETTLNVKILTVCSSNSCGAACGQACKGFRPKETHDSGNALPVTVNSIACFFSLRQDIPKNMLFGEAPRLFRSDCIA